MKTHTQTATVREMRTLTNTCQKHAACGAAAELYTFNFQNSTFNLKTFFTH